jgi:DNA-binding MarR family transcriptional regulator
MRTTMLSSAGMTKRLDRLAEAGLVERVANPNDRRGTLVKLTRRGKITIDRLPQSTSATNSSSSPHSVPHSSARWTSYCGRS